MSEQNSVILPELFQFKLNLTLLGKRLIVAAAAAAAVLDVFCAVGNGEDASESGELSSVFTEVVSIAPESSSADSFSALPARAIRADAASL